VQVVLKLNRSRKKNNKKERKKERKRERKKERKRISIVKDVDGTIQNIIKYYASIRNTIHAYRTCMQYSDIKKEFMKELLYIIQIIQ